MNKLYDLLPKSKEGRSIVGLGMILIGLFASAAILTIILIPLGIAILAFDHEWARKILRTVRDWLNNTRDSREKSQKSNQKN